MKKIVICEDSEIDREILKHVLNQYFEDINRKAEIVEYTTGDALLADVEEGYLDAEVLFLDIYMKGLNGMETAHKLREIKSKVPIIFLTASPDFAIESYEVRAAGYLLKPFDEGKLRKLLSRILKTECKRRIAVKVGRQHRYPYTDEIMYIESSGHSATLHMKDGSDIVTIEKLNDIEKRLDEGHFIRCNQSYLVNMDYIQDTDSDFILTDGTRIPIRVRGRKDVLDNYNVYFDKNSQ